MQIGRALVEGNFEHPDIPEQPTRREGESRRKYDRRLGLDPFWWTLNLSNALPLRIA